MYKIKIYNVANGALAATLPGHHEIVYDMEWGNVLLDENDSGPATQRTDLLASCVLLLFVCCHPRVIATDYRVVAVRERSGACTRNIPPVRCLQYFMRRLNSEAQELSQTWRFGRGRRQGRWGQGI